MDPPAKHAICSPVYAAHGERGKSIIQYHSVPFSTIQYFGTYCALIICTLVRTAQLSPGESKSGRPAATVFPFCSLLPMKRLHAHAICVTTCLPCPPCPLSSTPPNVLPLLTHAGLTRDRPPHPKATVQETVCRVLPIVNVWPFDVRTATAPFRHCCPSIQKPSTMIRQCV